MSYVLRSWQCLNRRCRAVFEHGDPNPPCPACGNVRVEWVPGGGHIGKVAPQMDRTLRSLAHRYGLTDMGRRGGTQAGEASKPDLPAPPPPDPNQRMFRPAPGFEVPLSTVPTAAFAGAAYPLKGTLPINGPRFKQSKERLPTQIIARDDRKVSA